MTKSAIVSLILGICLVNAPVNAVATWEAELVSASITPTEVNAGETMEVCVTVRNNGNESLFALEVAIIWGLSCDSDDVLDYIFLPSEVGPGEEVTVCDDIQIPVDTPSMSAAFTAKVDYFEDYPEPNESDNCIGQFDGVEIWGQDCSNPEALPDPVIVSAELTWAGWDENRIEVRVRNDGADGARGHITFTFPDLVAGLPSKVYDAVSPKSWSAGATLVKANPGEEIFDKNCDPMSAQYTIIEAIWDTWPAGTEKVFEVRIRRDGREDPSVSGLNSGTQFPNGLIDCVCGDPPGEEPCPPDNCDLDQFLVGYRASIECAAETGPDLCEWADPVQDAYLSPISNGGFGDFDQQRRWAMFIDIVPNGLPSSVRAGQSSWSALKARY